MTEFDHELIAALAEGTLPADEAADLEARIASDPAASAELEAQRVAIAAIAAAAPPRLDDLERRRLHRSVAAELDLVLPERAAPARRRWSVNWSALATAAAVLLGVALAAPLLSLLNTSDDTSDATTTVAAVAADDATDGDLQARSLAEGAPETAPAAADLETASAPVEEEAPPATTAVPDTTMLDAPLATGSDADAPLEFGPLDAELSQVRALVTTPGGFAYQEAAPEPPLCVTEVRERLAADGLDESATVTLLGTGTYEDRPVLVLAVAEGDVIRRLSAVDAADCTQLAEATLE